MGDESETDLRSAWMSFVDGLRAAGERLEADTAGLSVAERADGYRALLRALNNNLGRFEVDRERPELVAFNEWREKMLMDNPDFRYWVSDIADDRSYRITGMRGGAQYVSITVYRSGGTLDAGAIARIDSDEITFDTDGRFEVIVSPQRSDGDANWLPLVAGASAVWVRYFHGDVAHDDLGDCRIEPIDEPPPGPFIDPARFVHQVQRLGNAMAAMPKLLAASTKHDLQAPNQVRRWTEMTGGAAFTEPNIHYLRGAWQLGDDEALVIEGSVPACRYWNILLYSRYCNSLDHRRRRVSFTGSTARLDGDRYRFVIAGRDLGPDVDWLDSEGRPFGMFVLRFLQPEHEPEVPTVRVCQIDELSAGVGS
ncbi:MAG: DUF1214 domain-containing protein [Ilumatobacteraceae bacterium]|nr:MAG: DUF1214 domain-containing protein [Actinomycetota bacterium]